MVCGLPDSVGALREWVRSPGARCLAGQHASPLIRNCLDGPPATALDHYALFFQDQEYASDKQIRSRREATLLVFAILSQSTENHCASQSLKATHPIPGAIRCEFDRGRES